MRVRTFGVLVACLALPAAALAQTVQPISETRDPAGLQRLDAQSGGAALVTVHGATGGARFIRLQPGAVRALSGGVARSLAAQQERSRAFFQDYAALLGISAGSSMDFQSSSTDAIGETHLRWQQTYGGVPVFAGVIATHFSRDGLLKAVTGTAIPDLALSTRPSISTRRASDAALAIVRAEHAATDGLRVGTVRLYVFREGLVQGVPGENHLAYQVEVTNGAGIRELLFVDAQTAKLVDRYTGIQDDLKRRAYDGHDLAFAPQNYPNGAYWLEGQPFPTASTEANNMINASKEVYDFFKTAFNRDSFDDAGRALDAIFNRGYECPNASWNGTFISFCPGFTTDDVTAHEWGHAYTQYTDDLVYQWQPGALNESYSDIWGETIDRLNARGTDTPAAPRTGACSTFSPPVGELVVNSPATIAGPKFAQSAQFGEPLSETGITGEVVAAVDAGDAVGMFDGCTALTNAAAVAGKIALIDRGACEFSTKVLNAQNAGAVAVVIANNVPNGLPGMGAGAVASQVTIPSLGILQSDGAAIRSNLPGVNVTLLARPGTDDSVLWLMGEDVGTNDGTGAIRDMYNPTCYGNPGKVSDVAYYVCSTSDAGGVHTNSGVPNHAYALLVDGGTYNGQTIPAIGLTKAAHIYFRAQSVYQQFDTDFAAHADALEESCASLVLAGQPVPGLRQGDPAETITADDCNAVEAAIAAVELRSPAPCTFQPLLTQEPPVTCATRDTSGVTTGIFSATFDASDDGFVAATDPAGSSFTARQWTRETALPGGRAGAAFFAVDPPTSCTTGDESGVLHLTSPDIVLPAGTQFARATFEHWVATEPRWDGGNLKVSVNGGAWQLVPPGAYTFNGYNTTLFTAAQGNTDPLAGQPAWSGNDAGTVNGGTWGRTHVNLAGFAGAGDTVKLRWDFGTDVCAGRTGWYLDDVQVFSCTPKVPAIAINDPFLVEGDSGQQVLYFTILLSTRTIRPVSVSYAVNDGTAIHGNDFLPVSNGVATIPAGFLGVRLGIVLKSDIVQEPDETFSITLSNAVNATIAKAVGVGTIVNDDVLPVPQR